MTAVLRGISYEPVALEHARLSTTQHQRRCFTRIDKDLRGAHRERKRFVRRKRGPGACRAVYGAAGLVQMARVAACVV